jgi:hypothetical protein
MKPSFPDVITIGDKYGPAMQIEDAAEAAEYFEVCVDHHLRTAKAPITREEVERIERQNLGYYAGYYNVHTQERVERLVR